MHFKMSWGNWRPFCLDLNVLNTISEKYISMENIAVYTAFVDFSKFFDKSNENPYHTNYFDANIIGKVYSIIKSM